MKIFNFKNNPYDLVFRYIFDEYKKKNKIDNDTTIIYPGLGIDLISISKIAKEYNIKLVLIAMNNLDSKIKEELNKENIDLILIPSFGIEDLIIMADDMALDIEKSLVLNLFKEKLASSAYFKNSKDIYSLFKGHSVLYLDIYFGIFSGVAKYFKMNDMDIKIIGIKRIDYESEILDIDFFDEIIENEEYLENNSLIIKI